MTATYNIYPEFALVYLKVSGQQRMSSFGEYVFAIMDDERCKRGMDTLVDCREAIVSKHSEQEERSYRDFARKLTEDEDAPRRKVAIVSGESLVNFGVSRMREVPLSDSSIEMRVFKGMLEALDWLGHDHQIAVDLMANDVVIVS